MIGGYYMQTNSPQIYELISKYDNIVIGSHTNPDGDAVGSSLGLALCLAIMGKKPIVLLEDYSCKYSFIKGKEYIFKEDYDSLEPQLFISLDCSSPDRLGRAESVFKRAAETMCIDHHISNKNFADYNIVLADSSSTCEVVYDIIKNFCVLNESIAEALYTGIVSDTSAFKHKSTSPATLEAAARLISLGIDFSKIQTDVLYSHSKEQTAVFLKALGRYVIDGEICWSYLTKDEIINECKADYNDLDGISEYLLNFVGVSVSVFVYEKEDGTKKISMRSKELDISAVAVKYNGGGHKLAAGASITGSVDYAVETIVNEIKKELKKN